MYSTVGEPHVIYSPFLYAEDPWFVQDVYRYSALIPYRKYQCWPAESCQTPHWSKKLHKLATSNSACTDECQTHPSWGPKVTWCNSYKFHIYKRIILTHGRCRYAFLGCTRSADKAELRIISDLVALAVSSRANWWIVIFFGIWKSFPFLWW